VAFGKSTVVDVEVEVWVLDVDVATVVVGVVVPVVVAVVVPDSVALVVGVVLPLVVTVVVRVVGAVVVAVVMGDVLGEVVTVLVCVVVTVVVAVVVAVSVSTVVMVADVVVMDSVVDEDAVLVLVPEVLRVAAVVDVTVLVREIVDVVGSDVTLVGVIEDVAGNSVGTAAVPVVRGDSQNLPVKPNAHRHVAWHSATPSSPKAMLAEELSIEPDALPSSNPDTSVLEPSPPEFDKSIPLSPLPSLPDPKRPGTNVWERGGKGEVTQDASLRHGLSRRHTLMQGHKSRDTASVTENPIPSRQACTFAGAEDPLLRSI